MAMVKRKQPIIGVLHSTRDSAGKKTNYLRNLRNKLKELRDTGINEVGIEAIETELKKTSPEARNPNKRYFYGAHLLSKRARVQLKIIEDPVAEKIFAALASKKISGEATPLMIGKHHFGTLTPSQWLSLRDAASVLRGILMKKRAAELGIPAIIGATHAAQVDNGKNNVSYLEPYVHYAEEVSKEEQARRHKLRHKLEIKIFRKHRELLMRIYRTLKADE